MRKTVKRLICLCLAIGMMFSVVGLPASAYSTWAGYHVGSGKTLTFTPDKNFTPLSMQHMRESMTKWNTAAGRTLIDMSTSTFTCPAGYDYEEKDGNNYISRVGAGDAYIGHTHPTDYVLWTGEWKEVDININIDQPFANSAQKGKYDLYSIFLHEAGHACGVGHSLLSTAVMYKNSDMGVEKRILTTDDKNGVNEVYKNS